TTNDNQTILLREGASVDRTWLLIMHQSNDVRIYNENSSYFNAYNLNEINIWYNLTVIINDSIATFYKNGIFFDSGSIHYPFVYTPGEDLRFGNPLNGSHTPFKGVL